MGRVLFVTWQGGGNVNAVVAIGQQLQRLGHQVHVLGSATLGDRFAAAELAFTPRAAASEWNAGQQVDDVTDVCAALDPGVVVVDYMLPAALVATEAMGRTTVALVHTLYGALMRDGTVAPMTMAASGREINDLRAQLGLDPVARLGDLLDHVARVLVTVPATIDTPVKVPDNVRYVGPVFEPAGADGDWQPPPGDGPLIVVSLGTTDMDELPVLTNVLDALAHERARVFATVGDHADPAAIPTHGNATVSRFVQHAAVLPHADLVISHGGIGTALAAIAHGVPVLFLPLGRDQPANAKAIAATGAAKVLSPSSTPGQIARRRRAARRPVLPGGGRAGQGAGPAGRRRACGDGDHRRAHRTGRHGADVTGPEVVRTPDLDAAVARHVGELGYRLVMITPADSPRLAVVIAPDGTPRRLELEHGEAGPAVAAPADGIEFAFPADAGLAGRPGRAGMHYRDLTPSRLGGRCIASHILIPDGGPVPDYVHHHRIGLQLIACVAGWVRVVYEDQGAPFVLRAGDAVLQPPGIRHRVLEASMGLEVVELSCPAEHETFVDHELALPTGLLAPHRDFGGQRFAHHVGKVVPWAPGPIRGLVVRDSDIADATTGRAATRWLRPAPGAAGPITVTAPDDGTGRYRFWFVTTGALTVGAGGREPVALERGAALTAPATTPIELAAWTPDAELLEVVFALA